jgi:hypothetical protein
VREVDGSVSPGAAVEAPVPTGRTGTFNLAAKATLMELLEPVAQVQDMCRQLVPAVIERKLDTSDRPKRRRALPKPKSILGSEIHTLQAWAKRPDIRKAMLDNPITF